MSRGRVIAALRQRLEQRQLDADAEVPAQPTMADRRPRDADGNAKGGRYQREFGVPEAKGTGELHRYPDSWIKERAGSGFDPSYNVQTAVDATVTSSWSPELLEGVGRPDTPGHRAHAMFK